MHVLCDTYTWSSAVLVWMVVLRTTVWKSCSPAVVFGRVRGVNGIHLTGPSINCIPSAVVCGTTNKPNPVIECTPGEFRNEAVVVRWLD